MTSSASDSAFVLSQHTPEKVEVIGFSAVDSVSHMIDWLRRGPNFRQFVVHDAESELYAQDPGGQLLSAACLAKPQFETKIKPEKNSRTGVLSQFSVIFPILLRVRAASGVVWRLEVHHGYHASNLDVPDQFQLRLDFSIVGSQAE